MKKFVLLLVVLFMSAFMVGCGSDDDDSTPAVDTTVTTKAVGELQTYLEMYPDFYQGITGGVATNMLATTVKGENWTFRFTAGQESVSFDKAGTITTYNTVTELKTRLEEIRASFLTVTSAYYVDADTIMVKFASLENEVEITLTTPLVAGQSSVTFTYEGNTYTTPLTNAYVDGTYTVLNETTVNDMFIAVNTSTNTTAVTKNVTLPTSATVGSITYNIAWSSSNPSVIANDGTVTRPATNAGDADVTLTATFSFVKDATATTSAIAASVVKVSDKVYQITLKVLKRPMTVNGYYLELEIDNPNNLVSDGMTVMEITGYIRNENNNDELATDFAGEAIFLSDADRHSAQAVAAFENGKVHFKVPLKTELEIINDMISVQISKDTSNYGLINLVSNKLPVTYLVTGATGGASDVYTYPIGSVDASTADRVFVRMGDVKTAHLDRVKAAIVSQVKIINKANTTSPAINLAKVVKTTVLSENKANETASYGFEVLTELPQYKLTTITTGVAVNYGNDREVVLNDNQKNYYKIVSTGASINLETETSLEAVQKNYFFLKDSDLPSVSKVEADVNDFGMDVIAVVYDKSVNRLTAEDASSYTLNGQVLGDDLENRVEWIRVLEEEELGIEGNKELLELPGVQKIIARPEYEARGIALIKLKHKYASASLKSGKNNLQIKGVADWAGLTDLTDNNKVSTQDMTFEYERPVVKAESKLYLESPEQYVLVLKDVYPDLSSSNPLEVTPGMITAGLYPNATTTKASVYAYIPTDSSITTSNISVSVTKVVGDVSIKAEQDKYYLNKYNLTSNDEYFIIEMNRDFSQIIGPEGIFESRYFRVTFNNDAVDTNGVIVKKEDLTKSVFIPKDAISPKLDEFEFLDASGTTASGIEATSDVLSGSDITVTSSGSVWMRMSEPVQLFQEAATSTAFTIDPYEVEPAMTPGIAKDLTPIDKTEVSYEYRKIAEDGVTITDKVKGKIFGLETDHDMEFFVTPVEELTEGRWILITTTIADDVENNSDTFTLELYVKRGETVITPTVDGSNLIDPYIVWIAMVDDGQLTTTSTDYVTTPSANDHVYILFSRVMDSETLKSAVYDINGKKIDQDTQISSEEVPMYWVDESNTATSITAGNLGLAYNINNKAEYRGTLVRIKLPKDHIKNANDGFGLLTVPTSLKAEDDNIDATPENLLFDNNDGNNIYQMNFQTSDTFMTRTTKENFKHMFINLTSGAISGIDNPYGYMFTSQAALSAELGTIN